MAGRPAFAATPRAQVAAVSTANTNRDGTGTIVTIFTAGASGSKIEEVTIKATGDPADSIVTIFLHNGTSAFLFDEYDLGNPAAASTTVGSYFETHQYDNLILPSGWSLRAAITVALTAGQINVFAFGGDF